MHLIIIIFIIYFLTDAPWGSASMTFTTNSTIRHCGMYPCLNYGQATHPSLAQGFLRARFTQVVRSQRTHGGKRGTHWDLPAKRSGSQIPTELVGAGHLMSKSAGTIPGLGPPVPLQGQRCARGTVVIMPRAAVGMGSLLRLHATCRAKTIPLADRADQIL